MANREEKQSTSDPDKAPDAQNVPDPKATVSGYQEGIHYPTMPRTPEQFAELLDNPDMDAHLQSAPTPEKLNPHLFPNRLP